MQNFLLNVLPFLSGILLAYSYIPQIIQTIKTKDVSGISPSFWTLISLALLGLTISTGAVWYYTGSYGNFIVELFNVGLATTMLVLVFKYRKKGDEKQ